MITVNGKEYPLWSQFVEQKEKWIGGTLEDLGDSMDRRMGYKTSSTKITNIRLEPNGEESASLEVDGEDFGCGFDVGFGGIGTGENGWITFRGYMGHSWRIRRR